MSRSNSISLLLCLLLRAASAIGGQPPEPGHATLTVQVDQPGVKISPLLYGIFFEEINHAGDGGLYGELIRNRSFEDGDRPEHWALVTDGSGKGEMAIDDQKPASPMNRRSLRLSIAPGGEGRVGVANAGFWGIAVAKDAVYDLAVTARAADGFAGPLIATLESPDGKQVYAEGKIEGLTAEWKTFKPELTAKGADPKARLVLSAARPGTLWLDVVSLFPSKTWKGRANGLRLDLAEMLAGLRPGFVRFPGGCWVEGDRLETAYRWKQTIGEPSERRNQWNLWQYYSTHGLGYHEYLQLCEDLEAEPLFVVNCGMSHKENVPLDKMDEWVQDALDAIEYANGAAESKWGSLRAKAGHPAPFGLKYVEIGNENGGRAYDERYALFYDAIKAKYPEIRLVADQWGGTPGSRPVEMVDEHYYNSSEFFIQNAAKYDAYDRKGPKIYVGEYAVTQGCGRGNLRAAVGEAAFMTGMERNSDVVVMASYAPLFVNVNDRRWNPDLIVFDSSRVYGTPSYHVQKMFCRNRGDVVLPAKLEVADAPPTEAYHGRIGLGTWNTQAEFKDVKVTRGEEVLYQSDFSRGSDGWKVFKGDWKVKEGAYQQTADATDQRASAGDAAWQDYTYTLKARKLGGAEGFLVMFHVRDDNNWLWWNLGGWGNARHAIEECKGGGKSIVGGEVRGEIETGRWYDIRIELAGPRIRCFLDGKLIHDVTRPQAKLLYATASLEKSSGEVILKVVNVAKGPQPTKIVLGGVREVDRRASVEVLTSASLQDENSLDEPRKVAPQSQPLSIAGPAFSHTFPSNSVTILRVKAQPQDFRAQ